MPYRSHRRKKHTVATKKGPRVRLVSFFHERQEAYIKSREIHKRPASSLKSLRLLGSAPVRKANLEIVRANASMDTDSSSSSSSSSNAESLFASEAATTTHAHPLHKVLTSAPLIADELETETSRLQEETIAECLPLLRRTIFVESDDDDDNNNGHRDNYSKGPSTFVRDAAEEETRTNKKSSLKNAPKLNRKAHVNFLRSKLGSYPWYYAAMDASRPWVFYWALNGLALMGRDISEYTER